MSIRQGLLALLEQGPRYGYQLRSEFEACTGSTWPLNVGQVYTTLDRLARDGLVTEAGADDAGRVTYAITEAGRAEVDAWFATPIRRSDRPRDELAIKLAMAATVPNVDVRAVVQAQRTESMAVLRDYTRLKATRGRSLGEAGDTDNTDDSGDLAWSLVLDSLVFAAEAEVRWLDHVETRLVRRTRAASGTAATTQTAQAVGADEPVPEREPQR